MMHALLPRLVNDVLVEFALPFNKTLFQMVSVSNFGIIW